MSMKLSTKSGNDSMASSVKIDVKVVTISTAIKFYGRSPTYQSNPLDVSRAVRYRVWQTVVRTSFGKVWAKVLWEGVTTTVQLALYSLDTDYLSFSCRILERIISI